MRDAPSPVCAPGGFWLRAGDSDGAGDSNGAGRMQWSQSETPCHAPSCAKATRRVFPPCGPPSSGDLAESWHITSKTVHSALFFCSRAGGWSCPSSRPGQQHRITTSPPAKQLRVLPRPPNLQPGVPGRFTASPSRAAVPAQGRLLPGRCQHKWHRFQSPRRRGAGLGAAGHKSALTAARSHRSPGPAQVGSAAR